MKKYIEVLNGKNNLSFEEMTDAAKILFSDHSNEEDIEKFLIALANKGETSTEIVALIEVMRKEAIQLPNLLDEEYIDNCGTGGDGIQSFNISTASAFVIAAAGIKVAKHGNRKVSSSSGSSDVLEALGVRTDVKVEQLSEQLARENLAFIFAPAVHPKLKKIAAIRQKIGKPTIFNLVGPLVNPVNLTYQFTGISKSNLVFQYAEVMKQLGRKRAIVVSGEGGMDEASLFGMTQCVMLDEDELISFTITAEEMGLKSYPVEAIRGGNPTENAAILKALLKGKRDAYFEAVALNAGIAIYTAQKTASIQEGVSYAIELLTSGKAYEKFQALVKLNELEEVK